MIIKFIKNYFGELKYFALTFSIIFFFGIIIVKPIFSYLYIALYVEPLAYKLQNTDLFLRDSFISNLDNKWHPYLFIVNFLSNFSDKLWSEIYLIFWIISLFFITLSVNFFFRNILSSKNSNPYLNTIIFFLIIFFTIRNFENYSTFIPGDTSIFYPFLNTQLIANGFCFLGIVLNLKFESNYRSSLFLNSIIGSILIYIHIHIAIIYFTSIFFLINNNHLKIRIIQSGFIASVLASPMLFLIFEFFFENKSPADFDIISTLGYFRTAHHFTPSLMNKEVWVSFFLYYFFTLWVFNKTKRTIASNRTLKNFFEILFYIYTPTILFSGWFFIEIIPLKLFINLQLYRFLLVFEFFSLCLIIYFIFNILDLKITINLDKKFKNIFITFISIFLISYSISHLINDNRREIQSHNDIGFWLEKNTDKNSLIFISPDISYRSVIIDSKRSIYWDQYRVPHKEKDASLWLKRFCGIFSDPCDYNNDELPSLFNRKIEGIPILTKKNWENIIRISDCDFIVAKKDYDKKILGKILYENKGVIVKKCK